MSTDLYKEEIITLSKDTSAAGRLNNPDQSAKLDNPLCGDRVTLDLNMSNGLVAEVAHHVRGCARSENYSPAEVKAVSQSANHGGGVRGVVTTGAQVEGLVDAAEYAQSLDEIDLVREHTAMLQAKQAYSANLNVMKGIDELIRQIPGLQSD